MVLVRLLSIASYREIYCIRTSLDVYALCQCVDMFYQHSKQ